MTHLPHVTHVPAAGRSILSYDGLSSEISGLAMVEHHRTSLKAYLQAGFVCLVSGVLIGGALHELVNHTVILGPFQWFVAAGVNELLHMGLLDEAQEQFPRLMKALNVVTTAAFLGVSIHHAAAQWIKITESLVGVAAARALLLNLRHEFGVHVVSSVVKLVKICWKLFHKSDHDCAHP
jgi:hypothetical protein